MGLQLRILGPLEVVDGDGRLALGGAQQRRVLAVLAAYRGEPVSTDRLVDAVWGEKPPASAAKVVQNYVLRLRRCLADGRLGIETRGSGYALVAEADALDAALMERRVEAARARAAGGAFADAATAYRQALDLWRGDAFGEYASEPWAAVEARRLEALRAAALEEYSEAELALGNHASVLPLLEAEVAAHPLRERVWALLMLAQYRAGRQGEALRTYRRARETLVEELGIDPGPELRELEGAIVRQEAWLRAAPVAVARRPRGNLPTEATRFFGRGRDLERLVASLAPGRVTTVTGPGGVGKTRLVVHAAGELATRCREGAWFVDLAPVHDAEALLTVVAVALGVAPPPAASVRSAIFEFLADRELLVVLDNCEHLIEAVADLVARITTGCASVQVLATSREPLRVVNEQVLPLGPLSVPQPEAGAEEVLASDAGALFCDRARAVRPDFELDGESCAGVVAICRRLDGLPLALELAAARVAALAPAEIAARLDRPFAVLGRRRAATVRHRTLQDAFDWSYSLLDAEERLLLARLAVFPGSFALDAAAAVSAGDALVELLASLVDKSLLLAEGGRYRFLTPVREYAAGHLDDVARAEAARDHARHFVELAVAVDEQIRGPGEERLMRLLDAELDNLRAAFDTCEAEGDARRSLELVNALGHYATAALREEVWAWGDRALHMDGASDCDTFGAVLGWTAWGQFIGGSFDDAIVRTRAAVAALEGVDGPSGWARLPGAAALMYGGRPDEAAEELDQAIVELRTSGNPLELVPALMARAAFDAVTDRAERAQQAADEALAIAGGDSYPSAVAEALLAQGYAALPVDPARVHDFVEEAIALVRPVGNRWLIGNALFLDSEAAARHLDPLPALRTAVRALEYHEASGSRADVGVTLARMVELLERAGRDEGAALLHGAAGATGPSVVPLLAGRLAESAAALGRRLGRERFGDLCRRGAALSWSRVVDLALAEVEAALGVRPPAAGRSLAEPDRP